MLKWRPEKQRDFNVQMKTEKKGLDGFQFDFKNSKKLKDMLTERENTVKANQKSTTAQTALCNYAFMQDM